MYNPCFFMVVLKIQIFFRIKMKLKIIKGTLLIKKMTLIMDHFLFIFTVFLMAEEHIKCLCFKHFWCSL